MDKESPQATGPTPYIIDMSRHFSQFYLLLPANQSDFIDEFIEHAETNGLSGLEGRLKKSDEIPTSDRLWLTKVKYAQKHNLWHYHAGYPRWDMSKPFGDRTSEWVLHFMQHPCGTRSTLVHWDKHPPFQLPKSTQLII
ncbi:hypothetical protein [Pseudomonas fragi]|uniref:hypothetical protein n=1 Tax=Pseudomonas fragi TaxID=296 RepID=UPI0011402AD1|nr:hypothetical protein [Pseudomonas fragi]